MDGVVPSNSEVPYKEDTIFSAILAAILGQSLVTNHTLISSNSKKWATTLQIVHHFWRLGANLLS